MLFFLYNIYLIIMQRLCCAYKMWHELFSRNGFTFWLENPTSKQSSCSCSVTYLIMSSHACETLIRWMDASRLNCSTTWRVFCKLDAIMSILLVSLLGKWQLWKRRKVKMKGNWIRFDKQAGIVVLNIVHYAFLFEFSSTKCITDDDIFNLT